MHLKAEALIGKHGPLVITVRQIGALALSRPATITINP